MPSFRAKILTNVVFVLREELEDVNGLIERKPELALCIAYVSSLFVPGRRNVRRCLSQSVLPIVRRDLHAERLSDDHMWTTLQALSLLYLFALPTDGTTISSEDSLYQSDLSYRALKPLVESLALHTSLHRSYEDIIKQKLQSSTEISQSPSLKRYLLWLWLFTASQQYALITRTPPTISEDTTIRSAPVVLQTLQGNILVRKVLSQVDLYLVWGQIGQRYPNLREWWSSPYADLDLSSTKNMLQESNERLEEWRKRWMLAEPENELETTPALHENASIEFAFRYNKFHISTYVTRALYKAVSESVPDNGQSSSLVALTPPLLELFTQSIEAATEFCRFYVDLDPLIGETARYVSAMSFAKIAFACLYVVMASEVLAGPNLELGQHLDSVREAAVGMAELAVDHGAPPKVYADRILQRMQSKSNNQTLDAIRIASNKGEAVIGTADISGLVRKVASDAEDVTVPVTQPVAIHASNQAVEQGNHSTATGPILDYTDLNFLLSNDTEDFFYLDNDWTL